MASDSAGTFGDPETSSQLPDVDEIKWKPISLTHVEYPQGDFIGFILAWTSLLPIFIIVGFITLIIFRRDLHTISFFCGLIFSEATNWVIKHVIREERPKRDGRVGVLYTEFGMPSSHSQFMWFFATYLMFFVFIRVYRNHNFSEELWKYIASLGTFCTAIIVGYSRIYLHYHTFRQVSWGAATGAVLGMLWFFVVQVMFTPYFPHIASQPLAEYFMVRDSTLIPNVMWFEYKSSRAEARNRLRKQSTWKSQ